MDFDKITLIFVITILAFGLSFCLIASSNSPDAVFHKINSGEPVESYSGDVEVVKGNNGYYEVVGDDGQVFMTLVPNNASG